MTPRGLNASNPGISHALNRVFYSAGTVSFIAVGAIAVMAAVPAARSPLAMGLLAAVIGSGLYLYPALRKAIGPKASVLRKRLLSTLALLISAMTMAAGFAVRGVAAADIGPWLAVFTIAGGALLFVSAVRALLALASTRQT